MSSNDLVILIDDDSLVHMNWTYYCKKNGIKFVGFKVVEDFILAASAFDKSTKIFIDSNLGDGILGEVESEKIFNLGFINLFMATGHDVDSFLKPRWIKKVYSKGPECINTTEL